MFGIAGLALGFGLLPFGVFLGIWRALGLLGRLVNLALFQKLGRRFVVGARGAVAALALDLAVFLLLVVHGVLLGCQSKKRFEGRKVTGAISGPLPGNNGRHLDAGARAAPRPVCSLPWCRPVAAAGRRLFSGRA